MRKKEIKGYLTFSISMMLIISACSSKPAPITPIPTKAPIQSINPNDISIPGITDNVTPTTDPNAGVIPTNDPNTTPPTSAATVDPAATPISTATVDPMATTTSTPIATATPTVDPAATATATPIATPTPTAPPLTCSAQITGDLIGLAGSTVKLTAQNKCSDGTLGADTFNWVSSDVTIATVDSTGKVTGVKAGSANIIATSSLNAAIKTSVQFKVSNTCSIALSGDLKNVPELGLNSAKQLTAAVTCNDGSSGSVSWTTSDSSIATVGSSGLVEGKKKGNVTITAKLQSDASVNTTIAITVIDPNGNEQRTALVPEGKIYQPSGIDVRNGKIYISANDKGDGAFNLAEGHVKIYDSAGNETKIIEGGVGDGLPKELYGVASDGTRVWIVNRFPYAQSANNMYSFATTGAGRLNNKLGLTGTTGTDFQDIAIDPNTSSLYIASAGLQSVIKVNYDGSGIKKETEQKYFTGATKISPAGLGVDNLGNVLITNAASNPSTILKFGKDGNKVLEFNASGKNSAGPASVSALDDIAYDQNNGGIIYVLAQISGSWQVLRYDSSGNYIRSFGSGTMSQPEGIAVGTDGTVYVTDYAKGSVLQFGPGK